MLTSLELRWFLAGKLPQEILSWFEQDDLGGQLQLSETREDLYLYSPDMEYMGIKLRQGRLEIKWRQAELGVEQFAERVEGKLEKWGKWLCEDPTGESFQPINVVDKGSWISVKKERSQRLCDLCAVELTRLHIQEDDWWSFAFETVGADSIIMDELQTIASSVFKTYSGLELQAEDSYAYPRWLNIVTNNKHD